MDNLGEDLVPFRVVLDAHKVNPEIDVSWTKSVYLTFGSKTGIQSWFILKPEQMVT